jgi:predicted nucleic acid-binding protein
MLTGLDTNILCYALDPAYPEHKKLKNLLTNLSQENVVAINPTVLHETYHTLVFSQKWVPSEARKRLKMLLTHPYVEFFSQTKKTSTVALNLAVQYKLGGRDALVIANFLSNKVPVLYTHDQELLALKKISWRNLRMIIKDPLTSNDDEKPR